MDAKRVGVVGCGLMGSGIAQVCAQAGFETVVREVSQELLDRGFDRIRSFLDGAVQRGKLSADDRAATLGRLVGTTRLDDFAGCDLVIEAVVEDPETKRQVFAELDRICPPHAILASNTSSIPIIRMAAATRRPERVLGLHFMNPVPLMKLVEVVRAITTSEETLQAALGFVERLGKKWVVAKDRAGFIVNLLLVPYLLDAVRMVERNDATKEDIDAAVTLGLNHPMGPLTLLDFVGLDTILYIAEVLYEEYRDPDYAPPPLLKQMVMAGYLGRKSGRGFYEYG